MESTAAIADAFRRGAVDESINGDWPEIQMDLGLLPQDPAYRERKLQERRVKRRALPVPSEVSRTRENRAKHDAKRWDSLDWDITTLTLVNRAFGDVIRRALGKQAGSARTPAKAAAAKANGSKGGRSKGSKKSAAS